MSAGIGATVLFGGTFDPPHVGHVLSAAYALGCDDVEALWVLPVAHHPFGKHPASWEHRLAMCRLAFGVFDGRVSVREDELQSSGKTWDLVMKLKSEHPGRRFRLLLGSDQRAQSTRWHRFDDLCAAAPPLWVGRTGQGDDATDIVRLPDYSSTTARAHLAVGERPRWVPADVLAYALEHDLYTSRGDRG